MSERTGRHRELVKGLGEVFDAAEASESEVFAVLVNVVAITINEMHKQYGVPTKRLEEAFVEALRKTMQELHARNRSH